MSATSKSQLCLALSGSSSTRVLLCVLAFVATGMIVVRMGSNRGDETPQYTARAMVRLHATSFESNPVDHRRGSRNSDTRIIEQHVLSDGILTGALRQLGGAAGGLSLEDRAAGAAPDVEQVRQNLRVAAETPSPGRLQVSVSWSDRDPSHAVHLVNAIAKAYADERGAKQAAAARREYLEAQEAADRARQEYLEAQGRFDDFVEQHFLKQQALAERALERAAQLAAETAAEHAAAPRRVESPPSTPAVQVERPPLVANPAKLRLQGQLAELEEQRARLLMSRTSLHPEVRDLDVRIDVVTQRMAALPDEVPGQLVGPSPASEGPTLSGPGVVSPRAPVSQSAASNQAPARREEYRSAQETAEEYAQAVKAFRVHKGALDQVRGKYDRLSEAKRRAWERQLHLPHVEVDVAEGCEATARADAPPRPWMTALAAGLAVALGVGLISAGFDTDLPLTTLEEAEAAVRVPIVGRVPAPDPSSDDGPQQRAPRLGGRTKVFLGVLVVAICFAVLVVLF